jgi:transposase
MRPAQLAQRLRRRPRHETFTKRYRSGVQAGLAHNPVAAKVEGRNGRTKQSRALNLLQRLEEHETEVLYFIHDLAVLLSKRQA